MLLRLRRSGHLVSWTGAELLSAAPDTATEVESLAVALAGGPGRFGALNEDERERLTAQAVEELIRRQRGGGEGGGAVTPTGSLEQASREGKVVTSAAMPLRWVRLRHDSRNRENRSRTRRHEEHEMRANLPE